MPMTKTEEHYEVVVCGGGLAGLCAAVAAAREGAKTCLIQDRSVLGGNSSSEIRVSPHGAAACHAYARETGIISEILIEERARNHQVTMETGGMNSAWDMVLYDLAMTTPHLTLHLNTSILEVIPTTDNPATTAKPMGATEANATFGYYHRKACNESRRLAAVVCQVNHAEHVVTVNGKIFIDATGDGIVADLAGCEWRMGSESKAEFGEPHALPEASTGTMGSSIHFRTCDMGRPCPYEPPAWAIKHRDARYFQCCKRSLSDTRGGYWWFEISAPWNTIHDNETIRHELTRHVLGVWDWMKNHDPELKESLKNHALDWIGQVPGKRESRRIMGRHLLTENDVREGRVFPDEVAFGGWYIDLHEPGGLLIDRHDQPDAQDDHNPRTFCPPYGLPLRSLVSKDVDNLMMAGRNISATHVALGTIRVQGTTALIGQATGVAAAMALAGGHELARLPEACIQAVQQRLLRAGCFLLNAHNNDPLDLALTAHATSSSEASFVLAPPCTHEDEDVRKRYLQRDRLTHLRSQWIAVSTDKLQSISLFLINESGAEQTLEVRLVKAGHIWDYRLDESDLHILARSKLVVPAHHENWVEWPLAAEVPRGCYVRLDMMPNKALSWSTADSTVPEFPGAVEFEPGQMRRWGDICTSALRIDPPQKPWPAKHVLSGVTRPYQSTNTWRADADSALPQWLELCWETPITCSRCELTFPGNLLKEYHKYPPFWRDPQTPADYEIQIPESSGRWKTLIHVTGNYQRQRIHSWDKPVLTDRLRILVTKTNGDASAAITEVRCYS
jgi:hypothetical protein